MKKVIRKNYHSLFKKYPPSEPCICDVCVSYCSRPGWWTVEEARRAMKAGVGGRMMLEISPEITFGVLSPSFKGCESKYALQIYSKNWCTFLKENRCELFGTGYQPLECRFCHHERIGKGKKCHNDIEKEWNSKIGQSLVFEWGESIGFWKRMDAYRIYEVLQKRWSL